MERTNEEGDELWAHLRCISINHSINQTVKTMTTILVGYHVNTSCPCRAPGFQCIGLEYPQVTSLRGGHDDRMYKYKQKNARPLQSSLVVNSDFEYLHIKPPINKSKCHALPRRLSIHVSPTARRSILFILILIFVSRQEDMSDAAAWSYMCTLLRYYLVYYGVRSCVRCL